MPSNVPRASSAIFARVERSNLSGCVKVTSTPIIGPPIDWVSNSASTGASPALPAVSSPDRAILRVARDGPRFPLQELLGEKRAPGEERAFQPGSALGPSALCASSCSRAALKRDSDTVGGMQK